MEGIRNDASVMGVISDAGCRDLPSVSFSC